MKTDIDSFVRAVRGHCSAESMHWHLDVTFKEDANHTLDKTAAQNHNIIRKWCLSILKPLELMNSKLSMKKTVCDQVVACPIFRTSVICFLLCGRISHAFGMFLEHEVENMRQYTSTYISYFFFYRFRLKSLE